MVRAWHGRGAHGKRCPWLGAILTGGVTDPFMRRMFDEELPRKPSNTLAELVREDLARLSVAELDERMAVLEAEIIRTRRQRDSADRIRAEADKLFR